MNAPQTPAHSQPAQPAQPEPDPSTAAGPEVKAGVPVGMVNVEAAAFMQMISSGMEQFFAAQAAQTASDERVATARTKNDAEQERHAHAESMRGMFFAVVLTVLAVVVGYLMDNDTIVGAGLASGLTFLTQSVGGRRRSRPTREESGD